MASFIDARIPTVFGHAEDAGPTDALLLEGDGARTRGRDWFQPDGETAHPAGCPCCGPRNGAGKALARLMLARGRGDGLFFDRVIAVTATAAGQQAVREALEGDPIASGFFRHAGPRPSGTDC